MCFVYVSQLVEPMKSISNKWYWIGIGFGLVVSLVIFCSLLYLVLYVVDESTGKITLLISLLLYAFSLIFFFRKLFVAPTIQIDDMGILVSSSKKTTSILWSDILDICYYCPNGFLQMTTVTIKIANSLSDVKLYTDHYANRRDLVQVIKYGYSSFRQNGTVSLQNFIRKNIKPVNSSDTKLNKFEWVSHTPFGNPRSYFPLIGLFALYKLITAPPIHIVAVLIFVFIIACSFLIGTLGMGRVGFSDRFIVFSSFYYPYRKYYRLCDIECIVFEYPTKNSSKAARVITIDGGQKLFALANFSKDKWTSLGYALAKKGVTVTNR